MLTIREMDAVYGCAQLTLMAAAGSDAGVGLPGIRVGISQRQRTVHVAGGVTLADILPRLKERVLSTRKPYFTAQQTFYECPHGQSYEDDLYDVHGAETRVGTTDEAAPSGEPEDKCQLEQKGSLSYAIYEGIVREFTARTLSYEEDVEAAFEEAFTGVPPPDWAGWPRWTRHVSRQTYTITDSDPSWNEETVLIAEHLDHLPSIYRSL
ncbi:hypothetical protein B0H63DRAFT_541738 [Podospora didyma]|uniref:Uncharacterized protein n=1 Tax=Podospora didyma TaxID=330526 RepID=A0AAE0U1S1_9PEZI|nr:hypothetical protein B0H63DRAFT_541738 [Podospora didyma]